MVDVTQKTYGEKIEKSPPFAKEIKVIFSDDISAATAEKFNSGKNWMKAMVEEVIIDWNLTDGDKELPTTLEGLDKIQSLKLKKWIISTINEVVSSSLEIAKKN